MRRLLLAASVLAAALAASRVVAYEIAERSMEPSLRPGDWVLGWRQPRRLRRGQIVVIEHPMRPEFEMVKRIAATSGEEANGTMLGPGEIWVLGDNPDGGSIDSRSLGVLRTRWVKARLLLRYRPWPPTIIGSGGER
jgi:signal peptidase I